MSEKPILDVLVDRGFVESRSAGRRLLAQGAVRVDGRPVEERFAFGPDGWHLVHVGKHLSFYVRAESDPAVVQATIPYEGDPT